MGKFAPRLTNAWATSGLTPTSNSTPIKGSTIAVERMGSSGID